MKKVMMEHGMKLSDAIHVASVSKSGAQHIVSEDKEFESTLDKEDLAGHYGSLKLLKNILHS